MARHEQMASCMREFNTDLADFGGAAANEEGATASWGEARENTVSASVLHPYSEQ